MKSKSLKSEQGIAAVEIFLVLLILEVVVIFAVIGMMVALNISAYQQWKRIKTLTEATVSLNFIANLIDKCATTGKDCSKYNLTQYSTSNFNYYIDFYMPGGYSYVINAVKIDTKKNPILDFKNYPSTSFDCGGHIIVPNHTMSGVELCRDPTGNRTTFNIGEYQ